VSGLRHTRASIAVKAGVPIGTVSKQDGSCITGIHPASLFARKARDATEANDTIERQCIGKRVTTATGALPILGDQRRQIIRGELSSGICLGVCEADTFSHEEVHRIPSVVGIAPCEVT